MYQAVKNKNITKGQYRLSFITGAYPEGDSLMDLFIHPLNLVHYLFGGVKDVQVLKPSHGSYLVQAKHINDITGQLFFSTEGSWTNPVEELEVYTDQEILRSRGLNYLESEKKPKKIGPIPLEKVIKSNPQKELIVNNQVLYLSRKITLCTSKAIMEKLKPL